MKFNLIPIILLFVIVSIPAFAQSDDLVILHTKSGNIVIEFFPDDAPKHVENFLNLTKSGFYDNTVFHRVIPEFMIQGGDPLTKPGAFESFTQWGTGDPGYSINAEFNDIKHNRGILSMARSNNPNSAGSQFFIVHQDSNFLDGQYTVFGRIVTQESYNTLDIIANMPTPASTYTNITNTEVGATIPVNWGETEIVKTEVVSRSEVSDLLDLGEPERMAQSPVPPPQTLSENYSSEKFGFAITFPTGWIVQEPEKTQPGIPDVSAVAPSSNGLPSISVSLGEPNGKNLKELIDERRNTLQPSINSGQLEINLEEFTKINGKEAHTMVVTSNFQTTSGSFMVKFKETIIETPERFFMITYVDSEENFDNDLQLYEQTLDSFKPFSDNSNPNNGGGCLIATSTFGSELSPQVQQLRETRDNVLLKTESGKSFLTSFNQFYYTFSPTIADLEREHPIFKETVKIAITPLLASLSILNYVEINSELEMLGYGISLILLNIGMYFAIPAYIFYRLRK